MKVIMVLQVQALSVYAAIQLVNLVQDHYLHSVYHALVITFTKLKRVLAI